jgi:hypothetical protein
MWSRTLDLSEVDFRGKFQDLMGTIQGYIDEMTHRAEGGTPRPGTSRDLVPATFARRIAPAVLLTVVSPIIAEFLLGDFSIRSLALVLALLCGKARGDYPHVFRAGE